MPPGSTDALTLTDAAAATGMSRVTMRRYLDAGRFPHAFRADSNGRTPAPWMIPIADLIGAGLDLGALTGRAPGIADAAALAAALSVADERARTIRILTSELAAVRQLLRDVLLRSSRPEESDA